MIERAEVVFAMRVIVVIELGETGHLRSNCFHPFIAKLFDAWCDEDVAANPRPAKPVIEAPDTRRLLFVHDVLSCKIRQHTIAAGAVQKS